MNELLVHWGLQAWKPVLGSLALPPVPLILLALLGALWLPRRRALGALALFGSLLCLWLSCTTAVGQSLIEALTHPPQALSPAQITHLKGRDHTAIVVLGGGRRQKALEFGEADLQPYTAERLRFGLWLARQTNLPVMVTGGIGHGSPEGLSEAEIARKVAERDFNQRVRWTESKSRDTVENAQLSLPVLRAVGIQTVVLVTHDFHQQRAIAAFERAAHKQGLTLAIVPAPLGMPAPGELEATDWLPSSVGFTLTRLALHEWLGRLAGA